MSEKIIDTAEQTAEAAPKTAKKKPAAPKKVADTGGFCVYLGPTMMGVIQRGTIYRGGRKEVLDALAPVIAAVPADRVAGGERRNASRRPYQSQNARQPAVCELSQAGQGHEVRRNFQ